MVVLKNWLCDENHYYNTPHFSGRKSKFFELIIHGNLLINGLLINFYVNNFFFKFQQSLPCIIAFSSYR